MNTRHFENKNMNRHFWVLMHRYCGLTMALFLIVAGLSGSILAFYHELDGWLNPECSPDHLHISIQNRPLLDPFELRERALKQVPEARIDLVNLPVKPDEAYSLMLQPRLNPETGENFPLGYDSIALNPYTGEEIERNPVSPEQEGYFPLTRKNILQFVYALHYQLALGEMGMWLFWVVVVIWTVDCFVGFYLILPPRRKQNNIQPHLTKRQETRSFWQRWQVAWKVKWPASFFRVNFDLHRAFGLWLWLMLFIFAWSSVMLEIHVFDKLPPVYDKVMQTFFDYPPDEPLRINLTKTVPDPAIDFRTAHVIGQKLMQAQSEMRHFKVKQEVGLYYDQSHGDFQYIANTDREMDGKSLAATVKFDASTGKLLWSDPIAVGDYSGLTIKSWLFSLHMAQIWGMPYKVFVCVMGLVTTMLSVTGVYIWWKKRLATKAMQKKAASDDNIPRLNN
jgi:uncharacterized iron-regulated membrane protein